MASSIRWPASGVMGVMRRTAGAPSLRRNVAWTIAGDVVYAACLWGALVVVAKLGNPEMVGQFSLGLAVTAPVIMFANLQLRIVQATDARAEFQFGDYLGVRLITTSLALLGVVGIVLVAGYRDQTAMVVLVIGLAKGFDAMSDTAFGLFQQRERMDLIAKSMIATGLLSLLAFGGAVSVTNGIVWGAIGSCLVSALVLLTYNLRCGAQLLSYPKGEQSRFQSAGDMTATLWPRFDPRTMLRLIRLTIPLGFIMLLISLTTNVPRYFIARDLGERELGIFAAMGHVTTVGMMVIVALGQAVSPRLAKYYVGGNLAAVRTLTVKLLLIAALAGVGGIMAAWTIGQAVLSLLYGREYAQHADVLVLLAVASAAGFLGSVLGTVLTAMRGFYVQTPVLTAGLITTVVGSAVLVPHGLMGAGWALLGGSCIVTAAFGFLLLRRLRVISSGEESGGRATDHGGRSRDRLGRRNRDARQASVAPAATLGQPIRVLHVFGRMVRGGAEMRTVDVMRRLDARRFELHFCTLSELPGALDGEIGDLGGKVHPCPLDRSFHRQFRRLLREERFDVVHSHVHYPSGYILRLAAQEGVPVRVAHFRVTVDGQPDTPRRRLQRVLLRRWINRYATHILGVSHGTMEIAWGPDWRSDPRCQVIYNGVDASRFVGPPDHAGVRHEFDLPPHARLYIHVGRMDAQKNHSRLLSIVREVLQQDPDARLLVVGTGHTAVEQRVREQIAALELTGAVVLAGERSDVPRLLKAADALLFPSLWEGLPGVVLEACAAGTPVVASDLCGVREIAAHFSCVHLRSLEHDSDQAWAATALDLASAGRPPHAWEAAPRLFTESVFDIDRCTAALSAIWSEPMKDVGVRR